MKTLTIAYLLAITVAILTGLAMFARADTRTPLYLDSRSSVANVSCADNKSCMAVMVTSVFGPPPTTDYVAESDTALTTVFTFKRGGSAGTTLRTTTITFTDATKATLASVGKTEP
jgi:hypothetical protein